MMSSGALSVVLPTGWRRVDVGDGKGLSLTALSKGAGQQLRSLVDDVADGFGATETTFAAACFPPHEPSALAASMIVNRLGDSPRTIGELELELKAQGVTPLRRCSLGVGPAFERLATEVVEVDGDDVEVVSLQFFLPRPAMGSLLVSFSTPVVPLADQFVAVFRAIADTMRLQ